MTDDARSLSSTDQTPAALVRYFNRVEPLQIGGMALARVVTGKRLITIYEGDFTVDEALQLRAWLNSVLPL